MARKTKAEKRLAALQSQNRSLRSRLGGKKHGGKHRRRHGGGGKAGALATLKAAAPLVLIGAGGFFGARALFGLIGEKMPEQGNGVKVAAASLGPALVGAVALPAKYSLPLAVGAGLAAMVDQFGPTVADAIAESSPAAASAILTGMGGGAAGLINTPVLTPGVTIPPAQLALTDGSGVTAKPAGDYDSAGADASAALAGLGAIAQIQLANDHMSPYGR